ncbi:hypothetical protein BH10BAC6_BH10BAC6_14200 [soil metagenome]
MMLRYVVVLVLLCATHAMAQPLLSPYEFSLPDGLNIATPLSIPLGEVAGSKGRVGVKDGHLAFKDGTRLRLFGTCIQWSGVFPDSMQAMRIATRLRQLGFNAVRMNTFDISFWNGGSVLEPGTSTTGLSVAQMQKFDWFIYQLKQNGIYLVWPMIGVYSPRVDDGVQQPDSVGWAARVLVYFDKKVQQLVRNNMKMLLTHVNAYTGTAYKDEHAIAYFVVTDENSLMNNWMYSQDVVRPNRQGGTPSLGSQHLRTMDSLFHVYLRSLGYASSSDVQRAWSTTVADTSNSLRNGGFEDPFSAAWALAVATQQGAQALMQNSDADKVEGTTALRVRIGKLATPLYGYSIQLYQNLPMVRRLHKYKLSFFAKTTTQRGNRSMQLYLYNNGYPYNDYGLSQSVDLTSAWKRFEYNFTSTSTDSTSGALALQMGNDSGDVFLDDVRLQEMPYGGLQSGESLENRTIRRDQLWANQTSPTRAKDQAGFMFTSMRDFYHSMKLLFRDTLKCDVLIAPSTLTVSYMEQAAAEELDIQCMSEYQNSSQSILRNPNGGSVPAHSQARIAGKPFIVNFAAIQYPRYYQNELATYLPAYAALQDWDGVFMSSFTDRPTSGAASIDSNMVWEIMNKPGVLSLMPSASAAFRNGIVKTTDKVITIDLTSEAITYPRIHSPALYSLSTPIDGRMPLFRRVETSMKPAATESLLPHREISALAADMIDIRALDAENEQIFLNAQDGILQVITPRFVSLSGNLNGQVLQLPSMLVEQTSNTQHTVVTLASTSDAPITEAATTMLTVATRQLNKDATWNANNTELNAWGKGPIMMEGVTVRISITASSDSMIVRPLGADGAPTADVIKPTRSVSGRYSFTVNTQQYKTPWYRIELLSASGVDGESTTSASCAPNPASDHVTIRWNEFSTAQTITICDILGATVLVQGIQEGGRDAVINTSMLAPGTYIVRLGNETLRFTKQ